MWITFSSRPRTIKNQTDIKIDNGKLDVWSTISQFYTQRTLVSIGDRRWNLYHSCILAINRFPANVILENQCCPCQLFLFVFICQKMINFEAILRSRTYHEIRQVNVFIETNFASLWDYFHIMIREEKVARWSCF